MAEKRFPFCNNVQGKRIQSKFQIEFRRYTAEPSCVKCEKKRLYNAKTSISHIGHIQITPIFKATQTHFSDFFYLM